MSTPDATLNDLDVVALLHDVPEHKMLRGCVGTIVHVFNDGEAFEVEFCNRNGVPYATFPLRPESLMRLYFTDPLPHERDDEP